VLREGAESLVAEVGRAHRAEPIEHTLGDRLDRPRVIAGLPGLIGK